jgi:hypothetical protein
MTYLGIVYSIRLDNFIVIRQEPLIKYAASILEAVRVPASTASIVAESLVAANLRGVDSHGVQLLIWYCDQIRAGNVAIEQHGSVASENGAILVYDGHNGIGQQISTICCEHANRLAAAHGIGMVSARNSTHFGAAAWWDISESRCAIPRRSSLLGRAATGCWGRIRFACRSRVRIRFCSTWRRRRSR